MSILVGDRASWQFAGPTNIGGRVVDLALDPTNSPSTVYAAVSSGGIMKSTYNGMTWTPAWPVFDLKFTGDANTIYAATFGRGIYQIPAPPS